MGLSSPTTTLTGAITVTGIGKTGPVVVAGTADTPAKAPKWDTGDITALGNDDAGKTFIFLGATITVKTDAVAVAATASNGTTGTVTIANSATSATTAAGILGSIKRCKSSGRFTFSRLYICIKW